MAENKSYAGAIGNSGAQKVKAPYQVNTPKGKSVVKTGTDLRSGR